jgi:RNA polymerase sigma factor (sigma-70 family)
VDASNDPANPTLYLHRFPQLYARHLQAGFQQRDRLPSACCEKAGAWLEDSPLPRTISKETRVSAKIPSLGQMDWLRGGSEERPNEASGDCAMGFTAWTHNKRTKRSGPNGYSESFLRGSEIREQVNNTEIDQQRKLKLFEECVLPHLNAAYNLARWLTRNEHDAQDVVQESYLRAFRFFDSYRGGDGKSWLMAVVRNTCITWRRHEKRDVSNEPFDEMAHSSGRQAPNQEEKLVDSSRMSVLRNCIEMLPSEFREVLVMRELEEMSYRQISEVADLPVGTVMSRLSRARKRLEECAIRSEMGKEK